MVYPTDEIDEEKKHLLIQDNRRAKIERRLLRNTYKILRRRILGPRCFSNYHNLFKKKTALSESAEERKKNDNERRIAVWVLMQAREIYGYERLGEKERWLHTSGIDITTELGKKFTPKFLSKYIALCFPIPPRI